VNRDETDNYKQTHDVELTKQEVMPILEEQFKADVDAMINVELQNMTLLFGSSKKKKGKKKEEEGEEKEKEEGTQASWVQADQGHEQGRNALHFDPNQYYKEGSRSKLARFYR